MVSSSKVTLETVAVRTAVMRGVFYGVVFSSDVRYVSETAIENLVAVKIVIIYSHRVTL